MDKLRLVIASLALFSVLGSLPVAQAGGGGNGGGGAGGGASRGSQSTGRGAATASPTTGGATAVAPATGANAPGSTQNASTSSTTTSSRPEHSGPKTVNDVPAANWMHHKVVMGPCHHTDKSSQTESSATPPTLDSTSPKPSSDCV